MTIERKIVWLKNHCIGYEIHAGRLMAWDHWTYQGKNGDALIDITDYTSSQFLGWLGY